MKRVLFYRHRHAKPFRGHDLKVWDYFNHVLRAPDHTPYVHFERDAVWDAANPWSQCSEEHVVRGDVDFDPDALFLSGLDWYELEPGARERSPTPVLNLVQQVSHANPEDRTGRYEALGYKAIRLCLGPDVEQAIMATGRVRGPVFTIPAGIDRELMPEPLPLEARQLDLLIVAIKNPGLGNWLSERLEPHAASLRLLDTPVPRPAFLELMQRSKTTLFLPNQQEGFYIPAVEGMALRTLVVCPEAAGPYYCVDGENCLRPEYREEALLAAAIAAVEQPDRPDLLDNASRTAEEHDIGIERARFLEVLDRVDELWNEPA